MKAGADGIAAIKQAGGLTLAQDEASCAIYGMPKVAHQLGAVGKVLPLPQMASELIKVLTLKDRP